MNTLQTHAVPVPLDDLTLNLYGHGALPQDKLASAPTWSGSQYLLPRSTSSRELLPVAPQYFLKRLWLYFPTAWALICKTLSSDMPLWAMALVCMGGFNMSCFNVLNSVIMSNGWFQKYMSKQAKVATSASTPGPDDPAHFEETTAPTILTSQRKVDVDNGKKKSM